MHISVSHIVMVFKVFEINSSCVGVNKNSLENMKPLKNVGDIIYMFLINVAHFVA